jgi:hypothetical protein
MARIGMSGAPPPQAEDAVIAASHVVELPTMDLPDFPDIPELPQEMPNVVAPYLPEMSLPDASMAADAYTDLPVFVPPVDLPDFIFEIA